jgi:hypothetical protein
LLSLGGCRDLYWLLFGPSNSELAAFCRVSKQNLIATKAQVKQLEPYQSRPLGRCTVMRGDGKSDVAVMAISEPPGAKR